LCRQIIFFEHSAPNGGAKLGIGGSQSFDNDGDHGHDHRDDDDEPGQDKFEFRQRHNFLTTKPRPILKPSRLPPISLLPEVK
jgi:hypothetical protein